MRRMKMIGLVGGLILSALPANAENLFNSIAVSGNGAWGYGKNYSSKTSAGRRALQECFDQGGVNCEIVVWSRDGCVALAQSPNNGYGSGWGVNRGIAESYALQICRDNGNKSCRIKIAVCSY